MQRIDFRGVRLWQFEKLKTLTAVRHFVTDRNSIKSDQEFTMSLSSTPDKAFVQNNRRSVAEALGISEDHFFLPSQVHETKIVHVKKDTPREALADTDALVCNTHGVAIAVMSADCVPILLYDQKNNAVAAVHAGWKGTVSKILEKTLKKMKADFGTEGKDLIAAIGPSVCQRSYEVGEEVIHAVQNAFRQPEKLLQPKGEKAHFDLWMANRLQLTSFGVPEDQIEVANLCTIENNEFFFSARKGDRGRFAAGIMLV